MPADFSPHTLRFATDISRRYITFMVKVVRIIDRLNIGGPAIHVTLLCDAMRSLGWDSVLVHGRLAPDEGSFEALPDEHGVHVERIESLGRSISPLNDIAAFIRLYRLIRRERPQVVHTHKAKAGLLGRLAARLAGVPLIVHTFHGHLFSGYFGPWKTRLIIASERLMAHLTHKIIVLSPQQREDFVRRYRIAPAGKLRVVPLGLALEKFVHPASRDEARRQLGIPLDCTAIGIVGRLVPIKNHRLFLAAARTILRELPQCHFVIVGDGELRTDLEQLAARWHLAERVHFTGWLDHLEEVYPAFDIVTLTSNNEGTPVSLIEAMACGVPVVATAVGGVPDVLDNGRLGLLVLPNDATALAATIVETIRNLANAAARAQAARNHVLRTYTVDRLARDMDTLYRDLLAPAHSNSCIRSNE